MYVKCSDYYEVFKNVTDFYPYKFQMNISELFLKSQNIILNTPTGSGKTWAAIMPFVYAWKLWKEGLQRVGDFPRKLIYSLPLRTLANSLFNEVRNTLKEKAGELSISVKLQTGENPEDRLFEGDIIITTIDQTLSNILSIPLSLPKKLANINAGAVLSSYLVFDEFHLLDPQRSLSTTLILLKMMKSITPFCLMTATLSKDFLEKIADYLSADIVRIGEEDYNRFDFVIKGSEKKCHVQNEPLSAEALLREHRQKSIAICNTVDRCIELYKSIVNSEKVKKEAIEVICIHSQFFQKDRKEKELRIKELFGKNSNANAILISTQVVEVGLDISCDVMHTEISPINSLLQRAGRCARWEGKGEVFIYDIDKESGSYKPYNKELSIDTLSLLKKYQDQSLDYFLCQELIQKVMRQVEYQVFGEIKNNSQNTLDSIKTSWLTGNMSFTRELIREIRSISVVLLPEATQTNNLYQYDSLSINPHSLQKKISDTIGRYEGYSPNLVFTLEESNFDYDEQKMLYPICVEDIPRQNIVALNSDYIGYNSEFGLDFENPNGIQSSVIENNRPPAYAILSDSYQEHIEWMIAYYRQDKSHFYPLSRIQKDYFSDFDFEMSLKYILIMHDYGKLNQKWQSIVNEYQKIKYNKTGKEWKNIFLAHTDFDPNNTEDCKIQEQVGKKPDHAGIGAVVSLKILPLLLRWPKNRETRSLLQIIATTIIRHHAAFADHSPDYKIRKEAVAMVKSLLETHIPNLQEDVFYNESFYSGKSEDLLPYEIQFSDPLDTFIYFILVRMLRLSDQHSFEYNPLYKKKEK